MSCHYSCSTCSGNIYFDLCTACPATRALLVNTCPCSSGNYEYQQGQCTSSSSAGMLDSSILSTATFVLYAAIGIHYLIIVLTINRVLSIKLKKIIDTCQVLALISYYRFVQSEVATSGLKILDAFNFNYLTTLICTKSGPPYLCSNFQNLFGVGFSLIVFFLLFLLSYIIALCIYNAQDTGKESLGFLTYWHSLSSSAFFLYLDQTAILTTMSISRIAIINPYGLLVGVPFLIIIIFIVRAHFITINAPQQTTLAHRAKNSYFYYYDELYHLYYIDHLFQQDNLNENKETLKRPFYPQSNLMIMELLFKILLAASTIVCYEYEPYLFAYCCIFVLVAYCCMTNVFYGYQISEMWFYYLLIALHVFALVIFPVPSFFTYFIITAAVGLNILALIFVVTTILSWKKDKEGEMFVKTFELQHDKSQKIANLEESQSQLMANRNEDVQISHLDNQNIEPSLMDSPKERQNSLKRISNKNSVPDLSLNSFKKQSISNMNQPKPARQIYRQPSIQNTTTNRLTVRNKNTNQQLRKTIHEPSKGEHTENGEGNVNGNRMTKNIFAQINDSP